MSHLYLLHLVGDVIFSYNEAPGLTTYQASAVGGVSGLKRSSSTRSEAIMTDDLNDEDDDRRKRSSADWQSRHSRKTAKTHRSKIEQKQDFSWLGEHTESEFLGRSHKLEFPTISESRDDMSWLADDFSKAEEDDRKHRSVSRH